MNAGDGRGVTGVENPVERVRDVLQRANNYFPEAEKAAEDFRQLFMGGAADSGDLLEALIKHTAGDPGLRVRIFPVTVMGTQLRRYDYNRREILLSEALRRPQRIFHLLVQLALIRQSGFITDLTEAHRLEDDGARSLFRSILAGYFAAAVMILYSRFLKATRDL